MPPGAVRDDDRREFLRAAWNRGMPSNLSFWRDSTGTEIDVLRDEAGALWPVEVKSGQTVVGDMLKGLLKWQDLVDAPTGDPRLVFGGEGDCSRRGVRVMGWRAAEVPVPPVRRWSCGCLIACACRAQTPAGCPFGPCASPRCKPPLSVLPVVGPSPVMHDSNDEDARWLDAAEDPKRRRFTKQGRLHDLHSGQWLRGTPLSLRGETRRSRLETVLNPGEHLIPGNSRHLAGSQLRETALGHHHPFALDFGQRWIDCSEQRVYDHDPFFDGKACSFFYDLFHSMHRGSSFRRRSAQRITAA
jgi:hypothetical protein